MTLDRADIEALAADTIRRCKEVGPVPAWGDHVYIRRLSGDERDAWDLWQINQVYDEDDEKAGKGKEGRLRIETRGIRAFLVCRGVCDERGERLFADDEMRLVGSFDGEAVDYLYDQIREYNGLSTESQEELEKNSDEAGSGGSGSASPAPLE